jgi:hypothetical protein
MITAAASYKLAGGSAEIIGTARLVRSAYTGVDLNPTCADLTRRIAADPTDAAALLDLSILLLLNGQHGMAIEAQRLALSLRRSFHNVHGRGDGLKVLALMAPGDLQANTPIDFLLEGSDMVLISHYVDAATETLDNLPPHDVAFVAFAESEANNPILHNLERLLAGWRTPILNGAPQRLAALSRDGVASLLAAEASLLAPATALVPRSALDALAVGQGTLADHVPDAAWPIIVRPRDSHAGKGLEKIDGADELKAYLERYRDAEFYLSPFIDYRSADGRFAKYRVVFVDGRPFAGHAAFSHHWMIHYLNADMDKHELRRLEEAAWMGRFDTDFARRHAKAFAALHRRIGLDYFVVDCAELPDGRLLLFEAHVAMIVHTLDSEEVFPYKRPVMQRLFSAFAAALASAGASAETRRVAAQSR